MFLVLNKLMWHYAGNLKETWEIKVLEEVLGLMEQKVMLVKKGNQVNRLKVVLVNLVCLDWMVNLDLKDPMGQKVKKELVEMML